MNKIFGIGLSRTGTLSLTFALSKLGYKSCHFPESLEKVKFFDSLTDTPIAANYQELDKLYPNSKFILTLRDLPDWLSSCKALWETHADEFDDYISRIHLKLYGCLYFDEELFVKAYNRHLYEALDYFKNRNDLLTINICGGDGWEKLCPFLNKKIPDCDFPRVNGREFLYDKNGEWGHDYDGES